MRIKGLQLTTDSWAFPIFGSIPASGRLWHRVDGQRCLLQLKPDPLGGRKRGSLSRGFATILAMGTTPDDPVRRAHLADALRQEFEGSLDARIERYLRAAHHPIVAQTSFAAASSECVELFRDGHFYGAISLSQAVGEALVRYMCQSHSFRPAGDFEENVRLLHQRGFIDESFRGLTNHLWEKRHDYHHLNPGVATELSELEEIALAKIRTLAEMESWVFEYTVRDGKLEPKRPQYWRSMEPGELQAFLRLSP